MNASDRNDLLKPLTVQERGGGKISGCATIRWTPLSQPLSGTPDQLRGARVELKFGGETVAGVIVHGRFAGGER